MKKITTPITICGVLLLTLAGCELGIQESNIPAPTTYNYSVAISSVTQTNAPALQSFAHGVNGNEVLLFAGRTNRGADDGGIHNLSANYADSSFIPKSYNTDIFVYNAVSDELSSLESDMLLAKLQKQYCTSGDDACMNFFKNSINSLFKATNPISTQDGNTLYVLGGYGFGPDLGDSANYYTYNQIVTIDVPTMIKLVKGGTLADNDWEKLIRIGSDTSKKLISTGAEMFKIGDSIYLAGGHDFGGTVGQKYLYAVYPFITAKDASVDYKLTVSVGKAISNVPNPRTVDKNDTSTFRRRDGPVTAALFRGEDSTLIEGFNFYGGVFQPGNTDPVWNTAINIHPALNTRYTVDSDYNQNNQSVYACSDLTAYDASTDTLHTFILGGIGNDTSKLNPNYLGSNPTVKFKSTWLKGFTNSGVHIKMDLGTMKSSEPEVLVDIFPSDTTKLYGAESTLIPVLHGVTYVQIDGSDTEVIDLESTFSAGNTVTVGYVYGGIEAFQLNPGTYGPSNSAASNKVWKVTLTRTAN